MDFSRFHFHPAVASGLKAAGFSTPTPIQSQAIPPVMQGLDVMGLAQTGTGKTAAFALPMLHRLATAQHRRLSALVIAPTRELAEQIDQAIRQLGSKTRVKTATVYGGVGVNPQAQKLKRGVDIVVACPGRLLDHLNRGTVDLSGVDTLVLDEADQMFDMGFLPDIRRIMRALPKKRQNLLFSATMPPQIRRLAEDMLDHPVMVRAGNDAPAKTVRHALYPVASHLKTPLLIKLLHHTSMTSVLVFTRTKHRARQLGEKLSKGGFRSASLQGNLSQNRRQAALDGFRDGTFQILVATDIAARGIDVQKVSHVINYDIPATPEAYIHRIGRTGRAACSGEAFTLVTEEDTRLVNAIDRAVGSPIKRRTLADFDYDVTGPARSKPMPRGRRQKPSRQTADGNGKPRPGKGVYASMFSRNGRSRQPAGGRCGNRP